MAQQDMLKSLLSGAAAGLTVDVVLFPIDTIKTRLQSKQGFVKAGGFQGVYRGLGSAALGSVPSAALFFLAYDTSKSLLPLGMITNDVYRHMASGCIGEVFACMARIPFEVIKQTAQAHPGFNSRTSFEHVMSKHGFRGLFTGYSSMVFRDVPYSVIQMPLWEFFKSTVRNYRQNEISAFESGACGSLSGGITAALTTPLDVAKTRIILSQKSANPFRVVLDIAKEEGMGRLFSGVVPRVIWLSGGGFIFFGAYEFVKNWLNDFW